MIILGYFFIFLHKNICCGYSLEAPLWGASNEYPQYNCFNRELEKIITYKVIITKYSLAMPIKFFFFRCEMYIEGTH